jgi:membrane-bound inhibitor of C-type lysozyme
VTAWLVPAASGSKSEGQNLELWTKGDEATFTWRGEELTCQVNEGGGGE